MSRSSRRAVLTASLLPVLAGTAGCRPRRGGELTLRFWNGFTGPDGRTMLRLVRRFNAANPGVRVLMQRMDWGTLYNKLFVAGLGRRAPELFVVHTHAIERFARAGFARTTDDLVAGPEGLDLADLDANVWQGVEVGDRHYGLPLDVHPLTMYVNRRHFREAGADLAQKGSLDGRAAFVAGLEQLVRRGPDGRPDRWGFVFTNLESNVYTLMRQFGGEMFTPDYSRCTLDAPANVEALQFCRDLIRPHAVAPPPENIDAWVGFRQGKVATAWEGIYMLADLEKQADLEFDGLPVPQIGLRRAVWANSHNLCLRSDLDPDRLAATWRFVRFLSDHSLDWAEGGQVPVRKSLRATDRFRSMRVQSAAARQIPDLAYMPRVPFVFEFQTEFNTAVERALRGRTTPRQALATAAANVNRVLARHPRPRS